MDTATPQIHTLSLHDALPIFGQLNPLKRAGQPHEIAAMGLFLASDEASYVNGQAFPVDGGLTASMPDRRSTRLNSSDMSISYAVFCLKQKKINVRTRLYTYIC